MATRKTKGRDTSNRSARASGRSSSNRTHDHDEIRRWAESRGGKPARVRGTGEGGDGGLLRIDFPGGRGRDVLEEIGWDEFFATFDDRGLEMIYQERTATGRPSRFSKLVRRS